MCVCVGRGLRGEKRHKQSQPKSSDDNAQVNKHDKKLHETNYNNNNKTNSNWHKNMPKNAKPPHTHTHVVMHINFLLCTHFRLLSTAHIFSLNNLSVFFCSPLASILAPCNLLYTPTPSSSTLAVPSFTSSTRVIANVCMIHGIRSEMSLRQFCFSKFG